MVSLGSRQDDNLVWHEMRQTENFLASEFSKLSVEERSEALNDIHCVGKELEETPEIVERLLKEFNETARQVQNPIHTMAVNQHRAYVEDSFFQLRFPRCNMYYVHQSVDQMIRLLENKIHTLGRKRFTFIKLHIFNIILGPIPEVQTKGVVGVYYDVTMPAENAVMPVHTQTRTRIHYGTDMELQYTLRRHGVPTECCPVDINGSIRRDILNDWFQKHEVNHQWMSTRPGPRDILLGKGHRVQNHSGNVWFRKFLMPHRDEYDRVPRSLRQKISIRLTQTLIQNGSRFLKEENGGEWIDAEVEEAEKKVCQLFRTFRKNALVEFQ